MSCVGREGAFRPRWNAVALPTGPAVPMRLRNAVRGFARMPELDPFRTMDVARLSPTERLFVSTVQPGPGIGGVSFEVKRADAKILARREDFPEELFEHLIDNADSQG